VGKHDRVIVLIQACISQGIVRGTQLVSVIKELGFNAQHVGMTLTKGRGDDPVRHHRRREDGCAHSLLP